MGSSVYMHLSFSNVLFTDQAKKILKAEIDKIPNVYNIQFDNLQPEIHFNFIATKELLYLKPSNIFSLNMRNKLSNCSATANLLDIVWCEIYVCNNTSNTFTRQSGKPNFENDTFNCSPTSVDLNVDEILKYML